MKWTPLPIELAKCIDQYLFSYIIYRFGGTSNKVAMMFVSADYAIQSTKKMKWIPENKWIHLAPMVRERKHAAATLVNNQYIYVTGGFCSYLNCFLADVERYDIATNSWKQMAPLNHKRANHTCLFWNHSLYVIGGTDHYLDPLFSPLGMETYDLSDNEATWIIKKAMLHYLYGSTFGVSLGDWFYLCISEFYMYHVPTDTIHRHADSPDSVDFYKCIPIIWNMDCIAFMTRENREFIYFYHISSNSWFPNPDFKLVHPLYPTHQKAGFCIQSS